MDIHKSNVSSFAQESEGLDTKIFDWHLDPQPLTLIINVSEMPEKVEGGSTYLRKKDDGAIVELKQPAPGYATIFRGSAVYHRASAANYKRIIYVKTMEFADCTVLDKTESFFGFPYSDGVDLFTQHLTLKLNRLERQIKLMKEQPEQADKVYKVIEEEMENNKMFAKYAFKVLAGEEQVEDLIEKKIIQVPYVAN